MKLNANEVEIVRDALQRAWELGCVALGVDGMQWIRIKEEQVHPQSQVLIFETALNLMGGK